MQTPVEDCRTERSTLADKSDTARTCHGVREGRVQPGQRTHDAQAVGTHHTHPARLLHNLSFEFRALFAGLFETSGDDDRTLDPNLCALIDNAGHRLRRRHNDGQVYWLGHIQHTLVGLDAEYMRPPWINRKHRSSEGSVD